ncbi:MAG: hypothetical protein ACLR8Y_12310 [Alistipes indistinctus]
MRVSCSGCQRLRRQSRNDNSWKCDAYQAYSDDTGGPPQLPGFPRGQHPVCARKAIDGGICPEDKVRTSAMMVGDPNRPPFGKLVKRPIPQWKNHGLQGLCQGENHRRHAVTANYPTTHRSPRGWK